MSSKNIKIVLLISAAILFVLLFIAPKKVSDKQISETKSMPKTETSVSIEAFINIALKSLNLSEKNRFDSLIIVSQKNPHDSIFEMLADFWDSKKRPDFASFYVEKQAIKKPSIESFINAGNRYFYSVKFVNEPNEVPVLYKSAMRCYQKALEKEPSNSEAKIQLAACYLEEGANPMQGITILKEVEKVDSNNVKLQLNFAFFSVKSGQLDKALMRYQKVLAIDPNFIEAYLHLADVYEQLGENAKTINMLEIYASKTEDMMAKEEINKYIKQLKQKINN
jgi:tetratricopeptide (TPR) repeat protein